MLANPAAQELVLGLLEARTHIVTRRTLVEYHGAAGEQLIASGLLEHAGYEKVFVPTDEDDAPIYDVVVDERRRQLGYHSANNGWVPVQQEALARYKLRPDLIFAVLFGEELRRPAGGMVKIERGFVWEVGQVRLVRTELTSVWFARRLSDPVTRDRLRSANMRQRARTRRLILTSTLRDRLPDSFLLEGSTIVPITDVLDPYHVMRIDLGRLQAQFGNLPHVVITQPLHLTDDTKTLTILGTEIAFGGDNQRRAIRLIVEAYRAGRAVNAAATLQTAGFGPSTRTFRQAFKKQWPLLEPYLKAKNKLWRLELTP